MLEDLLMFAVVIEQSSLNRAAKLLNISQPALSRKIRSLESSLGAALFERNGKRLEPTRLGRTAYTHAVELRRWEAKFKAAVNLGREQTKPSITIGASLTTLQSTFPELIAIFTREAPELTVKAITGKTHEIVAYVRERKVDLGLVASRISEPGLACIPLFEDHLCLALPRSHPLAARSGLTARDLSGLPMILFSKGTWYRILMDEWFRQYAVQPDIRMEIDSFEAIIRLISTCELAALLPRSYLRSGWLEENGLTAVEVPELSRTTRTTTLIHPENTMPPADVEAIIRLAEKQFNRS